jgi:hypothetical protein
MPGIPQRRFYEHHFYFLDENLSLMSAGFLLPSPDAAVIWRGPKVRISANLRVSICSSTKIFEDPIFIVEFQEQRIKCILLCWEISKHHICFELIMNLGVVA